jgi:Flp pilus assembly protein TadG
MFRRFLRASRGSTITTFAIAAIPAFGAIGGAVDYSHAYEQKAAIQDALDAAALDAARLLGLRTPAEIDKAANDSFGASIAGKLVTRPLVTVSVDGGSVRLDTEIAVSTRFLGLFGLKDIVFDMTAKIVADTSATYEVVLALDNAGSMAGSRMRLLRQAATNLVDTLFAVNAANPNSKPVQVGLVPFAAAVNVGPEYQDDPKAAWLDRNGVGADHLENFLWSRATPATPVSGNRFTLFRQLKDVTWAGCVEMRPYPYDVNDTPADAADPKSLFVPMFAPDEPALAGYDNDYIADSSDACTSPEDTAPTTRANAGEAQARLCKYKDAAALPPGNGNGTVVGPNLNCTSQPLLPLTGDRTRLQVAIDAMQASGLTNIHAGVAWGWKLLSPGAPFSEGRPYRTAGNHKILVILTDGENRYDSYSNPDKSMYGAYGYVSAGHLGPPTTDNAAIVARMDAYTLETCANIKTTSDITIYTIGFDVGDSQPAIDLLRGCASSPATAFLSDSDDDLAGAFRHVAEDIAALRVEK